MKDEPRAPLIVLVHGDCLVSTKTLARAIGATRVAPCGPEVAERHTGYRVGGTPPFGTRAKLPVYIERPILELSRVLVDGVCRGFPVAIEPLALVRVLGAVAVEAGIR